MNDDLNNKNTELNDEILNSEGVNNEKNIDIKTEVTTSEESKVDETSNEVQVISEDEGTSIEPVVTPEVQVDGVIVAPEVNVEPIIESAPEVTIVSEPSVTSESVVSETNVTVTNNIPEINNNIEPLSSEELTKPILSTAAVIPNAATTSNQETTSENFLDKEKKRWPLILVLVVLVIAGLLCAFHYIYMSPKNMTNKMIDSVYTKFDSLFTIYTNNKNVTQELTDSSFTGEITTTSLDGMLDGIYAKLYAGTDKELKNIYFDFLLGLGETKIGAELYLKENTLYVKSDLLYDKPLFIEQEDTGLDLEEDESVIENVLDDTKKEFIKYYSKFLSEFLKNNLSQEKMNRKLVYDYVGDKKTPMYKYNYELEPKETLRLELEYYKAVYKDDKLIEYFLTFENENLEEYDKQTPAGYKEELQNTIDLYDELYKEEVFGDDETDYKLSFDVYFNLLGNNIKKIEIKRYPYDKNTHEAIWTVLVLENKCEIKYEETISDTTNKLNLVFDFNDDKMTFDYNIDMTDLFGEKKNAKITGAFDINNLETDNVELLFNIKYFDDSVVKDKSVLGVDAKFNYVFNDKNLRKMDTTGAVNFSELSEDELNAISDRILDAIGLGDFNEGFEQDYEYDTEEWEEEDFFYGSDISAGDDEIIGNKESSISFMEMFKNMFKKKSLR